jgi:hypothetical protein
MTFLRLYNRRLRNEHGLMVFENRVLRRITGPKRDEVTAEWRKLHNWGAPCVVLIPYIRQRREKYTGFWWEI